ncbi:MAG: hypothetical protein NZM38_08205 [Cytophagales bacterium]|nr:hypothetical protein [Cytophagales bacterium]MDW8384739.1 hypothetical protein [Flammeovirgaceae bacterium]
MDYVFKKELLLFLSVGTLVGVWSGCYRVPEYPVVPYIEYKDATQSLLVTPDSTILFLTVSLFFRDGDGDIGLNAEDTTDARFKPLDSNRQPNMFFYNYFATVKKKVNGVFQTAQFRTIDRNTGREILTDYIIRGRIPRLKDGRARPIEGVLSYRNDVLISRTGLLSPITFGDTIAFEIYILDRNLNRSNTILTPTILLRP